MKTARAACLLVAFGVFHALPVFAGRGLIETSLRRHAPPPHLYEEQTFVLTDSHGKVSVRTARYYALHDAAGSRSVRILETPAESRGIRLQVRQDAGGATERAALLAPVFGSDFRVGDLEQERPDDFDYRREPDRDLDRVPHHVLVALPRDAHASRRTSYPSRRLFLRRDSLFISRIDYLDHAQRLVRRQTFRDLHPDGSGAWRAGMIQMEDLMERRRSLLKIERRIESADYVPASLFLERP